MRDVRRLVRAALAAGGMGLAICLASCAAPGGAVPAAAPAAAGIPGAPAPVVAEPQGFFGKILANCEACRRKLCLTPAGAMLNSMTKPLSAATGGIIPGFCPIVPSAADLAKPGVGGASDAIKKDALEAKQRREKVRFLGTVDCRYYPDAIGALTAALRTDGSECVRYEAAVALNRGCCCNQKTIDALEASVSGTDKDGNPAERSIRVRCTAAAALERCLSCYIPPPPVEVDIGGIEKPELKPANPDKKGSDGMTQNKTATETADKKKAAHPDTRMPSKQTVEAAWQTLNDFNAMLVATRPQAAVPQTDRYSVYQIFKNVIDSPAPNDEPNASPASYPSPMATDPGTPIPTVHPSMTPQGRTTLGQPMAERGPIAPANPEARTASAEPPTVPTMPAAPPMTLAPSVTTTTTRNGVISEATVTVPITPAPAPGSTPLTPALNQMLHGATPVERQAAVRQIALHDWQKNPVVASALLLGAKNDPSAIVRVECIRQMSAGQMTHPQILTDLATLAQDSDQTVREEAAKALTQLKP